MKKKYLAHIALVIDDYDKAIEYYTNTLKFILIEDTILNDEKRWVLIAPSKEAETKILLAKASNEEQMSRIGNQTGGRVFLFLHTDNFKRDYQNLLNNHVKIVRNPVIEKWGKVLVFEDIYDNLWDLIEPANN
jgi:catechol 2,3-dioxygenase-like lactoylglutathione lyase family enzyme